LPPLLRSSISAGDGSIRRSGRYRPTGRR
jgi:hypothetical protein